MFKSVDKNESLRLTDRHNLEHLHWWSVCGPALKILDEVQEAYPAVNPLEYSYNPGKMHSLQGPGTALEESNKYTQIVIINCPFVSD